MLETDLKGLWTSLKNNQMVHLFILLGICMFLYMMLSNYMKSKNNFNDISNANQINYLNYLYGVNGTDSLNIKNEYCKGDIPKIDEAIIRNAIEFKNRNPAMLTSSMVVPEPSKPNDEVKRKTKMDILNMFYSSFDDDLTTIKARPQNLYIIP